MVKTKSSDRGNKISKVLSWSWKVEDSFTLICVIKLNVKKVKHIKSASKTRVASRLILLC